MASIAPTRAAMPMAEMEKPMWEVAGVVSRAEAMAEKYQLIRKVLVPAMTNRVRVRGGRGALRAAAGDGPGPS